MLIANDHFVCFKTLEVSWKTLNQAVGMKFATLFYGILLLASLTKETESFTAPIPGKKRMVFKKVKQTLAQFC